MSPVRRSPSSTMIPRLSPTWRTARSTFGSSRMDDGEHDLVEALAVEPREADDRRQRRPELVGHVGEEAALGLVGELRGRAGLLGLGHRVEQVARSAPRRASPGSGSAPRAPRAASRTPARRPAASRPCTAGARPRPAAAGRRACRSTSSTPTTRPWVTSGVPTNPAEPSTWPRGGCSSGRRRPSASRNWSGPSARASTAGAAASSSSGTREVGDEHAQARRPPGHAPVPDAARRRVRRDPWRPRSKPRRPTISASPSSTRRRRSCVDARRDAQRVDPAELREASPEASPRTAERPPEGRSAREAASARSGRKLSVRLPAAPGPRRRRPGTGAVTRPAAERAPDRRAGQGRDRGHDLEIRRAERPTGRRRARRPRASPHPPAAAATTRLPPARSASVARGSDAASSSSSAPPFAATVADDPGADPRAGGSGMPSPSEPGAAAQGSPSASSRNPRASWRQARELRHGRVDDGLHGVRAADGGGQVVDQRQLAVALEGLVSRGTACPAPGPRRTPGRTRPRARTCRPPPSPAGRRRRVPRSGRGSPAAGARGPPAPGSTTPSASRIVTRRIVREASRAETIGATWRWRTMSRRSSLMRLAQDARGRSRAARPGRTAWSGSGSRRRPGPPRGRAPGPSP